jgi:hypothetical protein
MGDVKGCMRGSRRLDWGLNETAMALGIVALGTTCVTPEGMAWESGAARCGGHWQWHSEIAEKNAQCSLGCGRYIRGSRAQLLSCQAKCDAVFVDPRVCSNTDTAPSQKTTSPAVRTASKSSELHAPVAVVSKEQRPKTSSDPPNKTLPDKKPIARAAQPGDTAINETPGNGTPQGTCSVQGPGGLPMTGPCYMFGGSGAAPQYSVIPSTPSKPIAQPAAPAPAGYLGTIQVGLDSFDYYTGPVLRSSDSSCINCNSISAPEPIDLLADPRGTSPDDVLTAEQKKRLTKWIEEQVKKEIKDHLRDKAIQIAFEAEKLAIQQAVGMSAGNFAAGMCGAEIGLMCGAAGYAAGWFAAGWAFDKAITMPFDYISSPSP